MTLSEGSPKRQLLLELLVAVLLSAIYFFCVKNYAVGIPHNTYNGAIFTSCSVADFQLDDVVRDSWKGRLSGLLLTGGMFDFLVHHSSGSLEQFSFIFGLYQAFWLFLLFLAVILAVRCSLFINLGIFAGVMYNFFPVCGFYFHPWDIPATLFFTLAVLLFEYRRLFLMVATICVGCFFKETVLVCALLVLFAEQWKWWQRILTFAGMVAVYALGKKLLLGQFHFAIASFAMNEANGLDDIFNKSLLGQNLQTLFSLNGLYVVFANAGTMAAVLLLGWQRRFLPCMIVILAFLAGQAMFGNFTECRIFMQILPLSLILLSERWRRSLPATETGDRLEKQSPETSSSSWTLLKPFPPLRWFVVLLVVLSTILVAWRYFAVLGKCDATERGRNYLKSDANIENLEATATWLKKAGADTEWKMSSASESQSEKRQLGVADGWFRGECFNVEIRLSHVFFDLGRYSEAVGHWHVARILSKSALTNSPAFNSNLAWLMATASDPHLRDGNAAVELAEQACQSTGYKVPAMVGMLAAAYAEAGQFDKAISTGQQACALASSLGDTNLLEQNQKLVNLYQSHQPYHGLTVH